MPNHAFFFLVRRKDQPAIPNFFLDRILRRCVTKREACLPRAWADSGGRARHRGTTTQPPRTKTELPASDTPGPPQSTRTSKRLLPATAPPAAD